mgnify:CR=1 FL=1
MSTVSGLHLALVATAVSVSDERVLFVWIHLSDFLLDDDVLHEDYFNDFVQRNCVRKFVDTEWLIIIFALRTLLQN